MVCRTNDKGINENRLDGGYTLHNYEGRGRALRTNVPSNTAMRGFGGPEGQIIIEEIVHKIAHELNMDPNPVKEVIIFGKTLRQSRESMKSISINFTKKNNSFKANYMVKKVTTA